MTKQDKKQSGRMHRRSKLPVAALIAALAGTAVWYGHDVLGPQVVKPDVEATLFSYQWKNGTTYTYSVDWKVEQTNKLVQIKQQNGQADTTNVAGGVKVSSDLVLRSYGKAGDVHVLGLSLANIKAFSWQVLGRAVVADSAVPAMFEGREAFLEVESTGRIRQTFFAGEAPSEFRGFVQWLAPQLQFVVTRSEAEWESGEWSLVEDTVLGRAHSAYGIDSESPLTFKRTRPRYESLAMGDVSQLEVKSDDVAAATCAPEGHLTGVESRVKLAISEQGTPQVAFDGSFSLKLKDVKDGPARSVALREFQAYAPNETPGADVAERTALANRVGKLTAGQMVSDVLEFANGGHMDQRWLWQATGLLQLNPEAAAELAAVFDDEGFTEKGRGLILDILASAGTAEAQAALRELLDSKAAAPNETAQAVLFNRIGLVAEANKETAEYVKERFADLKDKPMSPMRVASAYALGSVAAHQREQGNKALADELNNEIVDSLASASAPEEKTTLIRALGNSASPENVDTLADYTRHESSDVRAAAADAMRETKTPKSMEALLNLLRDPEWPVQQAALSSLSLYTLTVQESQQIEDLVVAGVVGSRNDPLLVTVLSRNATPDHPLAASFGHVLARNTENGQLAARIRTIARRNGITL